MCAELDTLDLLREGSPPVNLGARDPEETQVTKPEHELSIATFGVGFTISTNCVGVLQDFREYLPPLWQRKSPQATDIRYCVTHRFHPGSERATLSLSRNKVDMCRHDDRAVFLERFGSILALDLADKSRQFVFLHAGVVGFGDSAIVIPGRSFTGKTTLVAELVRAGATYYSDDFAAIDSEGMVHPYPRDLQIREARDYRQRRCSIQSLGGIAGAVPLPVGLVICSEYQEGASWFPRELSPGIGCLQMLDNAISARSAPAIALTTLKKVAAKASCVSGSRGDASQVIQWIITKFSGSPCPTSLLG